jgi:hypothetical protein
MDTFNKAVQLSNILSDIDLTHREPLEQIIDQVTESIKIKTTYRMYSDESTFCLLSMHIDLLTQFKNTCKEILNMIPDYKSDTTIEYNSQSD